MSAIQEVIQDLETQLAEINQALAVLRKWEPVLTRKFPDIEQVYQATREPSVISPESTLRLGVTESSVGFGAAGFTPLKIEIRNTVPTMPEADALPPLVLNVPERERKSHKAQPDARPKTSTGELNPRELDVLAIMRRNGGVATTKELRKHMKREFPNDEQHETMVRNTMTKLRYGGHVGRTGDTWSIIGVTDRQGE